jgi:NADP-dependent 3-hydroxy acid dehydrogenase YdfG
MGVRVSVIEPCLVDTPLILLHPSSIDGIVPGIRPMDPGDLAVAVRYVLEQPADVTVFEVVIRTAAQVL